MTKVPFMGIRVSRIESGQRGIGEVHRSFFIKVRSLSVVPTLGVAVRVLVMCVFIVLPLLNWHSNWLYLYRHDWIVR